MGITGVKEYAETFKTTEELYKVREQTAENKEYAYNKGAAGKKEYQDYLTKKFDGMTSETYDVNINQNLLEKAAGDTKTAAWLEYNLGQLPGCMKSLQESAAAKGGRIISCNYNINGYDDISTDVFAVFESDLDTGEQKERLEEIKERRKEEQEAKEKRLEERKEAKESKITIQSTDIDSIMDLGEQSTFTSGINGMVRFDARV